MSFFVREKVVAAKGATSLKGEEKSSLFPLKCDQSV
jgi:hypothetical protein